MTNGSGCEVFTFHGLAQPDPRPRDSATRCTFDAAEQQRRLATAFDTAVHERFILEQGPLFRARLYRTGPEDHTLLISAHHAVCDGWSWGVIWGELGALYANELDLGPPLEPAPRAQRWVRAQSRPGSGR